MWEPNARPYTDWNTTAQIQQTKAGSAVAAKRVSSNENSVNQPLLFVRGIPHYGV